MTFLYDMTDTVPDKYKYLCQRCKISSLYIRRFFFFIYFALFFNLNRSQKGGGKRERVGDRTLFYPAHE